MDKKFDTVSVADALPFVDNYRLSSVDNLPQWFLKFKRLGFEKYLESAGQLKKHSKIFDFVNGVEFADAPFIMPSLDLLLKYKMPDIEAYTLVLVNGRYVPELSSEEELPFSVLSDGIEFSILEDSEFLEDKLCLGNNVFSYLNSSAMSNGVVIDVKAGEILEKPIHIISIVTGIEELKGEKFSFMPRVVVRVGASAKVNLITSSFSLDVEKYFENRFVQIVLMDGAELCHYKITDISAGACVIDNLYTELATSSVYKQFTFLNKVGLYYGGQEFVLDEGASMIAPVSVMATGNSDITLNRSVEHKSNNSYSDIAVYGVASDRSVMTLNMDDKIASDKLGVTCLQNTHILLADDGPLVKIAPYQSIYSEEVEAYHGAVIAGVSDDALFFLLCRGIKEEEAKKILLKANLARVLKFIDNSELEKEFVKLIWE